jgi:tetratricopeptide (TPR) repeat protein
MALRRRFRRSRPVQLPGAKSAPKDEPAPEEAALRPSPALEAEDDLTDDVPPPPRTSTPAQKPPVKAAAKSRTVSCRGPFGGTLQSGPARPVRASGLADEHLDRGNIYAERGIWDEALDNFRKSVEISPEFAEGHNNYGVCCIYVGKYDEAIKALTLAAKNFPGWPTALSNLALAYQHAGKTDQAQAYYKQSLARYRQQPQVWVAYGMLLEAKGEADAALEAYGNAVSFAPNYDLGLLCLGLLLGRRGQTAEAEQYLLRALAVDPTLSRAHAVLGTITARRGDLRSAVERFKKAKETKPERVPSSAVRGLAAIDAFRRAVDKGRHELEATMPPTASIAQCLYAMGLAYVKQGNWPAALEAFRNTTEEAPDWAEPFMWLGILESRQDNADAAKRAWEHVLDLRPETGLAREQLGLLCYALGLRKEGEAHLKSARSLGREVVAPADASAGVESVVYVPEPAAPASSISMQPADEEQQAQALEEEPEELEPLGEGEAANGESKEGWEEIR